jgi:hypothetical protein
VAKTAVRVARLMMAELAVARVEVEAAVAMDATREAAAELEALRGSNTSNSVSTNGGTNDELEQVREATREQAAQRAVAHAQGCSGGSPDGRRRAGGAPGGVAHGGRAPDGGGNPDRRERASGWVDGDRGLYKRCSSPSPDRYHGHRGIQAIVRDVGPGGGWPTLTKTNYVEWAAVMNIRP